MGLIKLTKNVVKYTVKYGLMALGILYIMQSCEANKTSRAFDITQPVYASQSSRCTNSQEQKAKNYILNSEKTVYSDSVFDFLAKHPDGINSYKPAYKKDLSEILEDDEFPVTMQDITDILDNEKGFSEEERKNILQYSELVQETYRKADQKESRIFSRIQDRICSSIGNKSSISRSEYHKIIMENIDIEDWDELNMLEKDFLGKIKDLVDYIAKTDHFKTIGSNRKSRFFRKIDPAIKDYNSFLGLVQTKKEIEDIKLGYRVRLYE